MITNGVIPNGLSVHTLTGEIIGTPLDVTTSTVTLTIEAINPAGSITTTVDIDVQDEPPSSIDYPGSPYVHQERCGNWSNSNLYWRLHQHHGQ